MIEIKQVPVINQNLVELGKSVTDRIELLNIDNQVANTDTVKALKEIRAALNKELAEYEEQRKFVKGKVLEPYNEFENLYKSEISEKYKLAIDTLKDKISSVENSIKDEKKKSIESYFNELCQASEIDFLSFSNMGIDVNISTSEKKYKEECEVYVKRIKGDISIIDSQEHKAEILVEYKRTLDLSHSIKVVNARIEAEAIEKQKAEIQKINNRKSALVNLGFFPDSENFVYNDSIFISVAEIENLSKEDFTKKFLQLQEEIKNLKPVEEKPLEAPKVEAKEETYIAQFEVEGTMGQLKALKRFLTENNYSFKNL